MSRNSIAVRSIGHNCHRIILLTLLVATGFSGAIQASDQLCLYPIGTQKMFEGKARTGWSSVKFMASESPYLRWSLSDSSQIVSVARSIDTSVELAFDRRVFPPNIWNDVEKNSEFLIVCGDSAVAYSLSSGVSNGVVLIRFSDAFDGHGLLNQIVLEVAAKGGAATAIGIGNVGRNESESEALSARVYWIETYVLVVVVIGAVAAIVRMRSKKQRENRGRTPIVAPTPDSR